MPNWCHNTLEVIGPADEVAAFVNKARELPESETHPQPFFFANFIPEPDYEAENVEPAYPSEEGSDSVMPDWWNWRVTNWGTKWEPNFGQPFIALGSEGSDPSAEKDQLQLQELGDGISAVSYEFDTAWSPPGLVIQAAAKQHPSLFFRLVWGEPGEGYGGKCEWSDGKESHFEEGEAADYLPEEKMWF